MIFADFSVNFQLIVMRFYKHYTREILLKSFKYI